MVKMLTDADAAEMYELIAQGQSLRQIAAAWLCNATTVYRKLTETPEREQQYTRAKELQAEKLASEIIEIADDGVNDVVEIDGKKVTNYDVIARSKLRVEARKWIAAKLLPKKYGERSLTELSGDLTLKIVINDAQESSI